MIVAWTGDKLSRGQTSDYRTHRCTHRQMQPTTIPEGQNWPRVKTEEGRSWKETTIVQIMHELSIHHEAEEFPVCTTMIISSLLALIAMEFNHQEATIHQTLNSNMAHIKRQPSKQASFNYKGRSHVLNHCSVCGVQEVMNEIFDWLPQTTMWVPWWSDSVPYLYASNHRDCIFLQNI